MSAACGGGGASSPSPVAVSSLTGLNEDGVTANAGGEGRAVSAGYAAWLANPGQPGVDYNPQSLTVAYLPGAQLPKGISAVTPAVGQRAADQPGALVRLDKSYEALMDAIAARYGLKIDKQVYWGRVRVATFILPDGADGDRVLADLRREFAGGVRTAGYSQLYHRDAVYIPDDRTTRTARAAITEDVEPA
jgi:hypothetical protein